MFIALGFPFQVFIDLSQPALLLLRTPLTLVLYSISFYPEVQHTKTKLSTFIGK